MEARRWHPCKIRFQDLTAVCDRVMAVDPAEWRAEVAGQAGLFLKIYDSLPKELVYQRELRSARRVED